MSTHANMVKMTVSAVDATPSTGLGALTLNAASSGFQSFADAYGANATVDILITEGTAWEVARNCTYTHSGTTLSRGTFEDSSTGSAVVFTAAAVVSVVYTADSGRRWDSAALTYLADTVTTGNVTGVVGTMHGLDIDGMTAARDFVLPTAAATGDRIGVFCTTDAPTTAAYVLQIKSGATGDLINGTDHSSTIWSSLLIKGECLIFRCIDGSTVDWIVEYDGRIPCSGAAYPNDVTTNTGGTPKVAPLANQIADNANIVDVTTNNRIDIRRAGNYMLSIAGRHLNVPAAGNTWQVYAYKDGSALMAIQQQNPAEAAYQATVANIYPLIAGNYIQMYFNAGQTDKGLRGLSSVTWITILEVL